MLTLDSSIKTRKNCRWSCSINDAKTKSSATCRRTSELSFYRQERLLPRCPSLNMIVFKAVNSNNEETTWPIPLNLFQDYARSQHLVERGSRTESSSLGVAVSRYASLPGLGTPAPYPLLWGLSLQPDLGVWSFVPLRYLTGNHMSAKYVSFHVLRIPTLCYRFEIWKNNTWKFWFLQNVSSRAT